MSCGVMSCLKSTELISHMESIPPTNVSEVTYFSLNCAQATNTFSLFALVRCSFFFFYQIVVRQLKALELIAQLGSCTVHASLLWLPLCRTVIQ